MKNKKIIKCNKLCIDFYTHFVGMYRKLYIMHLNVSIIMDKIEKSVHKNGQIAKKPVLVRVYRIAECRQMKYLVKM